MGGEINVPGEHRELQAEAPSLLKVPLLHVRQAAARGCAAKVPEVQAMQPAEPSPGAAVPNGQGVQPKAPDAFEKVPCGHCAHAAPRKLALAKVPGKHGTQALRAAEAAVPGGH